MNQARVGVGIFIVKDGSILLGKRKNAHGEGEWALPGGKMEYGETVLETTFRELEEECGTDLAVENPRVILTLDLLSYMPKHFLEVGVCVDYVSGEAWVMEPHKVNSWEWFDMDNLPRPIFAGTLDYVSAYKDPSNNYFTRR